jgi:hypothetical protein
MTLNATGTAVGPPPSGRIKQMGDGATALQATLALFIELDEHDVAELRQMLRHKH